MTDEDVESALVESVEIRERIRSAFDALARNWEEGGGWRYPGFQPTGYPGPLAWSEGDYQFLFARLLDDQFPGCVHLEMPLRADLRPDLGLEKGAKDTSHIDIVVSDLSGLPDDPVEAGAIFRARQHEAFIEVKWFLKSDERWASVHRRDFRAGVPRDLERLSLHQRKHRCTVAAMLLVIDAPWVVGLVEELTVPTNVEPLFLTPPD